MIRPRGLLLAAILACLPFPVALPARGAVELETLETRDLQLVYPSPFLDYLAPYVAQCFQNSLAFQQRTLGYTPSSRVALILTDFSDAGNASAGAVPRNALMVGVSPITFAYETVTPNERMNWLLNHELVHIATADASSRADRRMRSLFFGKVGPVAEAPESILWFWLTAPRDAAPRWYHEGIAVFLETWMAGGQGRAQGAYDEMVFRSMVRDGTPLHDPLSLVSEGTKSDFQVEVNSYLYGTRFLSYLAWRWSPEDVVRWVSRPEGSRRYYADNFRHVFGMPLRDAWRDWGLFEREFQTRNLEALRQHPVTPARDLSTHALGSISKAAYDPATSTLYAAFHYQGTVAYIGSIDVEDGTTRRLAEVKGPLLYSVTSLALDPGTQTLFYTADNRDFRDLVALDLATGRRRLLLKDARIGDLAFDRASGSLWGIRHLGGIATLVRIPPPHTDWFQVRSWPYGEVPYDLDVSPDGTLVSMSVGGVDGLHHLRVFRSEDLLAGRADPVLEKDFGTAIPMGFTFAPDGGSLWGSSTYTGVSNVWRVTLEGGALEAMSNAETGFFRPIPREDGTALVFRYTGQGFVPAVIEPRVKEDLGTITFLGAQIAEKHPVVRSWMVPPPSTVPIDDLIVKRGTYGLAGGLQLESAYPVLEGYKDSVGLGYRVNLSDPLMLNRLSFTGSVSPDSSLPSSERGHARLEYRRYDWHVRAAWNLADFYDLFGPTLRSRKGYAVGFGWDRTLLIDDPRRATLSLEAEYSGNLERLPDYQNVAAPADQLMSARATYSFRNVRSSLGHVDDEKGITFEAFASADRDDGSPVPRAALALDAGFPTGRHSSLWLRTAAGAGFGDRDDPLSNFYFGAFGNNYVDRGEIRRYRGIESFPGLEINEVPARTFARALLEWNAPPLRFRRLGSPGFHATWARGSVFAGGLLADPDVDEARREVADAGVQVDIRFVALSRLDLTLSLGYAAAFEDGEPRRNEGMVSLKILP